MTDIVKVRILDEVNVVVHGLDKQHNERLYEKFGVFAPNYFFHPKFKLGRWDGKIRYFTKTGKTYLYLLEDILPEIVRMGYKIKLEDLRTTQVVQPEPIDANIFSHVTHMETGELITLRDYQIEAINKLIQHGYGICTAGTGAGKAQPLSSRVLTPSGWRLMKDIFIGGRVLTPSGKISKVLNVYPQGKKGIYKISFSDGTIAHSTGDHLWSVHIPKNKGTSATKKHILTTRQIETFLNQQDRKGNVSVGIVSPQSFDIQVTLPVHPYVLGALLGDGCLRVDQVLFTSADQYVLDQLSHHLSGICKVVHKNKLDYKLVHPDWTSHFNSANLLKIGLQQLNLLGCKSYEKFIPLQYKLSSIEDRKLLIRGLIDTDGTVSKKGQIQYYTTSKQMALDVQEIVQSLGYYASLTSRTTKYTYQNVVKRGKDCFTVHISGPNVSDLVSLPRKKERCNDVYRNGNKIFSKRIINIEFDGVEEAQCLLIDDEEHLYITNGYTATHNTLACAAVVAAYDKCGIKSITIVPDQTLIRQTKLEYINCGLDTGEYSGLDKDINHSHIVSTWQALKNNPAILTLFQMVIVDECLDGQSLITMADGSKKQIKEVQVGDRVISFDEQQQKFVEDTVIKQHENLMISSNEKMFLLEFNTGQTISVTGNHKIFTTAGYVRADELTADHDIVSPFTEMHK